MIPSSQELSVTRPWRSSQSTQPVIRKCSTQHRSAVIAAQHQSLAVATSAATAEPRAHRSPVTRRCQRQQQRHSESPEPALPQAFSLPALPLHCCPVLHPPHCLPRHHRHPPPPCILRC